MVDSAVHITVRGRVQGVGFRFFVREQAARFGVKGWVRNRADGAVEVLAEGSRETLLEFLEKVREGPRFGGVSDFNVEWEEPSLKYSSFSIEF